MFVMLSVSFLPPECTRGWRRKKNTERVADKKREKERKKESCRGKRNRRKNEDSRLVATTPY